MSEFNIAHTLANMVAAPAGTATPKVIFKTEDGVLFCYGTAAVNVAPLTTASIYAPGCVYIKIVAAGTSVLYLNTGTFASPSWTDQK
jgi:hypothetical protein